MPIKRRKRFEAHVASESLSDIMFFLMLFFLIVATVANPSVIKLLLPKASDSHQAVSKKQVVLSITQDKRYYLDDKETSIDNLAADLKTAMTLVQEPTIILRADKSLQVQDLVDVMAIGVKVKAKMVLATNVSKD